MKTHRTLAERWLWLGVAALATAGIFALVPVIGRTPQLKDIPVVQQFFDVALVVHVDLSVLVWFLAMLGMGTALTLQRHAISWPIWPKAGWGAMAFAALLIVASPLGAWNPLKSNYIPVMHNPIFLLGLGLFAAGLLVALLPVVVTFLQAKHWQKLDASERGWVAASLVMLLALLGYYVDAQHLDPTLPLLPRYEALFWGGGHIMQFSFSLIAMASWLVLLEALGSKMPSRVAMNIAYAITVLGAAASLVGLLLHPTGSDEFTAFQTRIMIEMGGVGTSLMAILVVARLIKVRLTRANRVYAMMLIISLILYYAGGALGLMISGQNVTIPAHYHGMIVGITLALMGLSYAVLPRLGYQSVAGSRLAFWQPIVYGLGQMMHIGGLAYCGGYGILRKTAGGFEHLAPDIKIALGIFGFGGLLAITGGLLFVIVMLRARKDPSASLQPSVL